MTEQACYFHADHRTQCPWCNPGKFSVPPMPALPKATTCEHDYECTYEGWDGERYRCKKCRDSYFLDYDEMR